jgi:hypothetical protein
LAFAVIMRENISTKLIKNLAAGRAFFAIKLLQIEYLIVQTKELRRFVQLKFSKLKLVSKVKAFFHYFLS